MSTINNNLLVIYAETFKGLKALLELDITQNKISVLEDKAFKDLISLKRIYLPDNYFQRISCLLLNNTKLVNIYMQSNAITNCCFTNLKYVKLLKISENKLTYISKVTFAGLTSLACLNLAKNFIHKIDRAAFKDLIKLENRYLHNNNLTCLSGTLFHRLKHLKSLTLSGNGIHSVMQNAFAGVLSVNEVLEIDLRNNKISELKWDLFLNSSAVTPQKGVLSFKSVKIFIDAVTFKCTQSLCWMKHMNWNNIYTNLGGNEIKTNCDEELKVICPDKSN